MVIMYTQYKYHTHNDSLTSIVRHHHTHNDSQTSPYSSYYKSLLQDMICQAYNDAEQTLPFTVASDKQTRVMLDIVTRASTQLEQLQVCIST